MPDTPPELQLNVTTVYLLLGRLEQKVDGGFEGVHGRLDILNGQTRKHAEEIAVLKDRSDKAETTTQAVAEKAQVATDEAATVRSKAMKWGTVATGVLYTIIEAAKALWHNAPGQ